MPISVEDLKSFAEARASGSHCEAEIRAAISRAYYAQFHTVLPFAERLPRSTKCPKDSIDVTHKELTDRLNEWRTSAVHPGLARLTMTRNQLVNTLQSARAARVVADYKLDRNCTPDVVKQQLHRLQNIRVAMSQLIRIMEEPAA
jgi:hypothetical protein